MEIIAGTEASIVLVERYEFLRFRSIDKRGNGEMCNDGVVESSGKKCDEVIICKLFNKHEGLELVGYGNEVNDFIKVRG